MFRETAIRIREWLADLPLDGARIANVGSSTEHFWREQQPHIWRAVMEPLTQRGTLLNIDPKMGLGVDAPSIPPGWNPDLILCCSMIEHVADPGAVLSEFHAALNPCGWLLLDVPSRYPHHPDPIDNGLRWSSREESEAAMGDGWRVARFEIIARAGTDQACALVLAVKA